MPKPVVLRTDAELNMCASVLAELANIATLITADNDDVPTLIRQAADTELIFTCYAPITTEVIRAAPKLRGIVKYGVGVDSVDLDAASKRNIPVVHCPDYGTETVADQAFALMLALARKIVPTDRDMRQQGWLWPEERYRGADLCGKTLGIIGYGRIGKAMSRRAAGFGMRRLVYDPYVPADDQTIDQSFTSLEAVLEQADFLSLHCVLTDETRSILDAQAIAKMQPHAVVVNVSRGALIDEDSLVEALEGGRIAGAGLDVFRNEPLPPDHPLLRMDNVVLSPHFAFYSREAHQRLERECLEAIRSLLEGELPPNVRNAAQLAGQNGRRAEQVVCASPTQNGKTSKLDLSEGDVNLSSHRVVWQERHVDAATRALLDRDESNFTHQSLSTPCLTSLRGCEGIHLIDESGRRYMDFHGNSAHQVGYAHPKVVDAIKRQLDELAFCPRRYTNQRAIELAERLVSLAPGRLNRVLLTPSGAGAIGLAMKIARIATGRHKTISMWDSFHGASLDAISIGGEALFRDGMGPLLPGAFHVAWPREASDAEQVERILVEQGDIGAVIAEPMRCTTVERPEDEYWHRVRDLCHQHGALLIFDEIPLALGRTGRMFCCEHAGVEPDVLVIGKGLGGGVMPMAAVIAREDLNCAPTGALGHYTHEKSPVGAAAALATFDVIEDEKLLDRAFKLGAYGLERLIQLKHECPSVCDVRGLGLSMAIELSQEGSIAGDTAERVMYRCLSRGLSFKVSAGNVLTLTPPLTIERAQLDEAIDIIRESIREVIDNTAPPRSGSEHHSTKQ